ncbi:MAG: nucleotidyltransferase domain-containing protein [bacterium]|nr:nucleotidyltransferase domain-containing protein [bacterium]
MQQELPPLIAQWKDDIVRIISKQLDMTTTHVFVFGSHADGTAHAGSDIDIGIETSEPLPDATMALLKEELESLPTLRSFELVDFATVSDEFREVAEKQIIVLN